MSTIEEQLASTTPERCVEVGPAGLRCVELAGHGGDHRAPTGKGWPTHWPQTPATVCHVAWCDQREQGHDFDSHTPDGRARARAHSADMGTLTLETESNDPEDPQKEAYVDLSALETLTDTGSHTEPPQIVLCAAWVHLTADQAREVAAMLTAAADRLDTITGHPIDCPADAAEAIGGASAALVSRLRGVLGKVSDTRTG